MSIAPKSVIDNQDVSRQKPHLRSHTGALGRAFCDMSIPARAAQITSSASSAIIEASPGPVFPTYGAVTPTRVRHCSGCRHISTRSQGNLVETQLQINISSPHPGPTPVCSPPFVSRNPTVAPLLRIVTAGLHIEVESKTVDRFAALSAANNCIIPSSFKINRTANRFGINVARFRSRLDPWRDILPTIAVWVQTKSCCVRSYGVVTLHITSSVAFGFPPILT